MSATPLPPRLVAGDHVAVISPASSPSEQQLVDTVEELESWGLVVEVGSHALARHGFMAGTDTDRLRDLNKALANPEVRAIVASRGGAGAYRIANAIDSRAACADPKPLVGFSDITNLHVSLWAGAGVRTIHGCLGRNQVASDVRSLLMNGSGLTITSDASLLSAGIHVPGVAQGPLIGGNLRELAGCVGAGLPSLRGSIVFLEDLRHVGIGQVDRNLTQLIRSGSLDGVAGIALGLFAGFDDYEDRGWTIIEVLRDRLCGLGIPVLGGMAAGHGGVNAAGTPDQRALCLGAPATLDADTGTLAMGPCVA